MLWFWIVIVSQFANAGAQLLDKFLLTKKFPRASVLTFWTAVGNLLGVVFVFWNFNFFPGWYLLAISILSGVAFTVALQFFYIAMKSGEASHVAPLVGGAVPIFTFAVSYFWLAERLTSFQMMAVVLLVAGALLISFEKSRQHNGLHIGMLYAVIAGAFFALSYVRRILDNERLLEVHPYFEKVAKEKGFYSKEVMEKVAEAGSISDIAEIPQSEKEVFVTSFDITPSWHVKMQAAFQKYTHNAVSKTVNFPHESTEEDIREVYLSAYETGCKGVTVYRDRSREEQVLNIDTKLEKALPPGKAVGPRPRPNVIYGTTTKIATGCGNLYITINEDENGLPFEIFMQMGKAGGCAMSQLEAIGRLLSLALRSGIEINAIIEQLRGIRCPSPSWEKGGRIFSCSDAIARVIERRLVKTEDREVSHDSKESSAVESGSASTNGTSVAVKKRKGSIVGVCPDCGGALWHVEGCMVCKSCGYSKCG